MVLIKFYIYILCLLTIFNKKKNIYSYLLRNIINDVFFNVSEISNNVNNF